MTFDYLEDPDQHLDPAIAAAYDRGHAGRFSPNDIDPTVRTLTELAGGGPAVEFAVGTGRVALPLARAGVEVHGLDFSEPMLAELQSKPDAGLVSVTHGDMTATKVCDNASLVYLVFNTIGNLRSQELQVACFANAADHLAPGGRFVIETVVPQLHQLSPGDTIRPSDVSDNHLGFDEFIDMANQIQISHHYFVNGDRARVVKGAFRYVWPSELDLMAHLAGMEREHRWADWHQSPFTSSSPAHVSVWRKPETA